MLDTGYNGRAQNVSESLNKILSAHLSRHSQQQLLWCVCWLMWEAASGRGTKTLPWGTVWVSSSIPERCVCSGPGILSLIWGLSTPFIVCVGLMYSKGRSCVCREYANPVFHLIEPNQAALFPLRKTSFPRFYMASCSHSPNVCCSWCTFPCVGQNIHF